MRAVNTPGLNAPVIPCTPPKARPGSASSNEQCVRLLYVMQQTKHQQYSQLFSEKNRHSRRLKTQAQAQAHVASTHPEELQVSTPLLHIVVYVLEHQCHRLKGQGQALLLTALSLTIHLLSIVAALKRLARQCFWPGPSFSIRSGAACPGAKGRSPISRAWVVDCSILALLHSTQSMTQGMLSTVEFESCCAPCASPSKAQQPF